MTKEDLFDAYGCNPYPDGSYCGGEGCSRCESEFYNDLGEFEKEIRADEIEKVLYKLKQELIHAEGLGRKGLESVLLILEQLKEQKNE